MGRLKKHWRICCKSNGKRNKQNSPPQQPLRGGLVLFWDRMKGIAHFIQPHGKGWNAGLAAKFLQLLFGNLSFARVVCGGTKVYSRDGRHLKFNVERRCLSTHMNALDNSPFRFVLPNGIFRKECTCQKAIILPVKLICGNIVQQLFRDLRTFW